MAIALPGWAAGMAKPLIRISAGGAFLPFPGASRFRSAAPLGMRRIPQGERASLERDQPL